MSDFFNQSPAKTNNQTNQQQQQQQKTNIVSIKVKSNFSNKYINNYTQETKKIETMTIVILFVFVFEHEIQLTDETKIVW